MIDKLYLENFKQQPLHRGHIFLQFLKVSNISLSAIDGAPKVLYLCISSLVILLSEVLGLGT